MKITKQTLKAIIKEELEAIRQEGLLDMFKRNKVQKEPTSIPTDEPVAASGSENAEDLISDISGSSADQQTKDEAINLIRKVGRMLSPSWIGSNAAGLASAEDKESFLGGLISDLQRQLEDSQ